MRNLQKEEIKSKYGRMETLGRKIGMGRGLGRQKTQYSVLISFMYWGEDFGGILVLDESLAVFGSPFLSCAF